ncbi:PEP-CTERM sorting domain-containing protein [Siccirubricoccus sp. G192]|uniref:PEP-CTERM sorting domain-containing protein n=1 Tax=Siccirubricoccus sp. G192 TaxID=2849651 RepID=UPI001C2BBE07|nr:PEP-CTERM sorting domain-containing protein [Siccirubricoccus sp. G192]MBV1797506.1 PEP-CTERM sorting domain-containing protein [Siccirubricoccus sp. G192]
MASASAAPILEGSQIAITGGVDPLGAGGSGKISMATGLDFLNSGIAGTTGGTIALNAAPTGSFAGLLTLAGCTLAASAGGCGTIVDLPAGSLVLGALSIESFYTINTGGPTLYFDLLSLTDITRTSAGQSSLSISGEGIFRLAGFDDTPASFTLTAQGRNLTTFSATTAATAVPEPASLALFGAGLLGLAAVRRGAQAGRRLRALSGNLTGRRPA